MGRIDEPRRWQRAIQHLASSRPAAAFLARTLPHLDRPLLRISNGQVSLTSVLTGLPVVALTTTGARSGQPRTVPLVAIVDGNRVVLVASSFGRSHHPAWYHNLRANPEAVLSLHGRSGVYVAREAVDEEREEYWRRAVSLYAGYAAYARRTGGRRIPILVLSPKGEPK